MVKNVKAVSMLSVYHRYMIIDEEIGEVLDDAQGYGYKTAQTCLECYKDDKEPSYQDFKDLLVEFDDFDGNACSLYKYVSGH